MEQLIVSWNLQVQWDRFSTWIYQCSGMLWEWIDYDSKLNLAYSPAPLNVHTQLNNVMDVRYLWRRHCCFTPGAWSTIQVHELLLCWILWGLQYYNSSYMYAKCWSKGIHTQGLVAEDDPVCKNNTAPIHIYSTKIFVLYISWENQRAYQMLLWVQSF